MNDRASWIELVGTVNELFPYPKFTPTYCWLEDAHRKGLLTDEEWSYLRRRASEFILALLRESRRVAA